MLTTSDGLGHNRVYRIVSDRQGFLWFCTTGGLTRYDGQRLANFGFEEGAPFVSTNDLLELPEGDFWIATNGNGIVRMTTNVSLRPADGGGGRSLFRAYNIPGGASANRANRVILDRANRVWIATDGGLFHLTESKGVVQIRAVPLGIPGDPAPQIIGLAEGDEGSVYAGTRHGLVRLLPSGGQVYYPLASEGSYFSDLGVTLYDHGVVWYGQRPGLFLLKPSVLTRPVPTGETQVDQSLARAERKPATQFRGLPLTPDEATLFQPSRAAAANYVSAIHKTPRGTVLLATGAGMFEFRNGDLRKILPDFPFQHVLEFGEDPAGSDWVATPDSGVVRLDPPGYAAYGKADGIEDLPIDVAVDRAGEVIAGGGRRLFVLSGARFRQLELKPPAHGALAAGGSFLQDHLGVWWVGTTKGVYRFPKTSRALDLARQKPTQFYTRERGATENEIYVFFKDSRGDVWMSGAPVPLTRWERSSGRLFRYSSADGLPAEDTKPDLITEDRRGKVLFGFRDGSVLRYRNGSFERLTRFTDGPAGPVRGIAADSENRIWCSIGLRGLLRIDEPSPSRFETQIYSTRQGLRSILLGGGVFVGQGGLIYAGSTHGLDRLDPDSGAVNHFGPAEGIPNESVRTMASGKDGAIWVATQNQLVRLNSPAPVDTSPAHVLISGLRVSGVVYQVPPVGAKDLDLNDLSYLNNSVQIDYVKLWFRGQQHLRLLL